MREYDFYDDLDVCGDDDIELLEGDVIHSGEKTGPDFDEITVQSNCDWEMPEWTLERGYVITSKPPNVCKECDFMMTCFQSRTVDMLWMPQLTPVSGAAFEIMTKIGKITKMKALGQLREKDYNRCMRQAQMRIFELGI